MASICVASRFDFTRSGYLSLNLGTLRNVNLANHSWLNVAYFSISGAYNIHLDDAAAPSDYNARWFGFSLRCLSSLPRPSGRGRRRLIVCHRSGF